MPNTKVKNHIKGISTKTLLWTYFATVMAWVFSKSFQGLFSIFLFVLFVVLVIVSIALTTIKIKNVDIDIQTEITVNRKRKK